MPFRSAYKISGNIVRKCMQEGKTLENLTLDEYKQFDDCFDNDVFDAIDLNACVERRISLGGTSVSSVESQISVVRSIIQ